MKVMQHIARMLAVMMALGWGTEAVQAWVDQIPPPEKYDGKRQDYGRGVRSLLLPACTDTKVFKAVDNQANFTVFENACDVAVKDGTLGFAAASNVVTLGWGNVAGRQDLKAIAAIPAGVRKVSLKIRQTGGAPSKWTILNWWRDGRVDQSSRQNNPQVEIQAGAWREVQLPSVRGADLYDADGLEIKLETEPGVRFEIAEIAFIKDYFAGYVRKEFVVPEGKIWRAVANVGWVNWGQFYNGQIKCALYVNGKQVERNRMGLGVYESQPVDLKPYLKPGQNCIGLYGEREDYSPYAFVEGAIVMESGEIIPLRTDPTWQFRRQAESGWNLPEFAASGWTTNLAVSGGISFQCQNRFPAWTGCLQVNNPCRKDLVFTETSKAVMQVCIPVGLAARNPVVKYEIDRSDKYGHCERVGAGEIKQHAVRDGSLKYTLDAGKLKDGVYTLALSLLDGGGSVLEERWLEPFVVLRKLELKEVSGRDIKQGLDLEQETAIDFTDPNSATPNLEVSTAGGKPEWVTHPAIVTKAGLTYRELTGKDRNSFMSYRLEFKHPGDFYLCEVEYPDNADRCFLTVVSKCPWDNGAYNTVIGVGAETGGKFYKTGKMQTFAYLFGAPAGPAIFDVKNVIQGWPAAVKSVRFHHVKGDLVSAGAGQGRRYGIVTERDWPGNGFSRSFYPDFIGNMKSFQGEWSGPEFLKLPYTQQVLIKLWAMKAACEKYVQYLKFSGQNSHVIGCYQYNAWNSPYLPFYHDRICSSVVPCLRSMLANCLDVNGISFYAGVEFLTHATVHSTAHLAAVRQGAETVWMINSRGEQHYVPWGIPNWLHPQYREVYQGVLKELDNTFGDLENYRGVFNSLGPNQEWLGLPAWGDENFDPLAYSYDDLTFRLFEEEVGVKLGIDLKDPDRFAKRATLIKSHPVYREKFLAWRCRKVCDFLAAAAAVVRKNRPNLEFVNYLPFESIEFTEKYLASGRLFKEYIKDYGFDVDQFGRIEGLTLNRFCTIYASVHSPHVPKAFIATQVPEMWVLREKADVTALLEGCPRRGVFCRTIWDEGINTMPTRKYPGASDKGVQVWGAATNVTFYRTRSSPLPASYNAREGLIQGLIASDPAMLWVGVTDVALNCGYEQEIREVMRIYTRLPWDNFKNELGTGLNSNFAIRSLSKNGQSWLYAANPGYWAIEGTIAIEAGGKVFDLADGKQAAAKGKGELKVKLEPFGLAAWRVDSERLKVLAYQTGKIGDHELAFMRDGIIGRVNALLEDKKAKRVLSPADRKYMREITDQAAALLDKGEYAAAWALLKTPTFWNYWKFYLEKAAEYAAMLPGGINPPERLSDGELPSLTAVKANRVDIQADLIAAPVWKNAPATAEFVTMDTGKTTCNPTVVKALYDDDFLYFGFICADPDPAAVKADAGEGRAVLAAQDDVLGVFFQPHSRADVYYQLIVNPKGVGYDQHAAYGVKKNSYQGEYGKEVIHKKYSGYWTFVIKVPRKSIGAVGSLTDAKANFYRMMRNNLLQIAVWSPIFDANKPGQGGKLHDTTRFGRLVFQ